MDTCKAYITGFKNVPKLEIDMLVKILWLINMFLRAIDDVNITPLSSGLFKAGLVHQWSAFVKSDS